MKISVSKFYQEVTKSKTANSVVCQPALERWGVPFTKGIKGDAVDASYLDVAKAKWEAECAEREAEAVAVQWQESEAAIAQPVRRNHSAARQG